MGKIIRRILTIIPAVALQSLWLLLLMKWLTKKPSEAIRPSTVRILFLKLLEKTILNQEALISRHPKSF